MIRYFFTTSAKHIEKRTFYFPFTAGELHATRVFTILVILAGLAAGALFVIRHFVMKEKPVLSNLAAATALVGGMKTPSF